MSKVVIYIRTEGPLFEANYRGELSLVIHQAGAEFRLHGPFADETILTDSKGNETGRIHVFDERLLRPPTVSS